MNISSIQEKQERAAELTRSLDRSLEIEKELPGIFEHGAVQPRLIMAMSDITKMRGRQRKMDVISAKMIDGAGTAHPLTRDQVARLYPDLHIHKEFRA